MTLLYLLYAVPFTFENLKKLYFTAYAMIYISQKINDVQIYKLTKA